MPDEITRGKFGFWRAGPGRCGAVGKCKASRSPLAMANTPVEHMQRHAISIRAFLNIHDRYSRTTSRVSLMVSLVRSRSVIPRSWPAHAHAPLDSRLRTDSAHVYTRKYARTSRPPNIDTTTTNHAQPSTNHILYKLQGRPAEQPAKRGQRRRRATRRTRAEAALPRALSIWSPSKARVQPSTTWPMLMRHSSTWEI